MLLGLILLYASLLILASGLALWKGSRWLLCACAAVALGWLLTNVLVVPQRGWIHHVQWGVLFADTLVLVAFAAIAALYRRWWSIGLASLQLTAVALHLVYAARPMLWGSAYAGAEQVIGWSVVLVLTVAASVSKRWER